MVGFFFFTLIIACASTAIINVALIVNDYFLFYSEAYASVQNRSIVFFIYIINVVHLFGLHVCNTHQFPNQQYLTH